MCIYKKTMKSQIVTSFCALALVMTYVELVQARLSLRQEWQAYKQKHGKVYERPEEDSRRFSLFIRSRAKIEALRGAETHQRGLNHLSDWTEEERKQLAGLKPSRKSLNNILSQSFEENRPEDEQFLQSILNDPSPVPDQVDWRKVANRVSPVKDQKHCGSCWAFSATGVLEGQQVIRLNNMTSLVELSEQDLMECSVLDFGCAGGMPDRALKDIVDLGGIESEREYPYVGVPNAEGPCVFAKNKSVIVNKGAVVLPRLSEAKMKLVVALYGPISVAIDSRDLHDYHSGIYDNDKCFKSLDHAVLIVGYGTDPKQGDFWIVKNSYSEAWGNKGYFLLRRGKNTCGVALHAVIATF